MILRRRRQARRLPWRRLGGLVLAATLVTASLAHAGPRHSPVGTVTDFFRWKQPIPAALREALDAYEEGRFPTVVAALEPILTARDPAYALDDAQFLRSLALVALGWSDLAAASLGSLLDGNPPGPYYVPALLELVELHERAGRFAAVAAAWERYVDRPLGSGGSRGERVRDLLFEFGTLRPPTETSTRREKSWLSRPKELAVLLEKRRERASDRLLYRCGLALVRLRRYPESLRAMRMIGLESPYYPYARYSIAQAEFALGHDEDARRALSRLADYPAITREERALGARAKLLRAAIAVDAGEVDEAIRLARSVPDDSPQAAQARLLVTTALVDAGKPALALVYDTTSGGPAVAEDARRALLMGTAYIALGDREAAARTLRAAAAWVRGARATADERSLEGLRRMAVSAVEGRREQERARRQHVAAALRTALADEGPWGFATLLRRMRSALGAGPHRELALGTRMTTPPPLADAGPWLFYLASNRRAAIEDGLERLADVESAPGDRDPALSVLGAYVFWLEAAPVEAKQQGRPLAAAMEDLARRIGVELPERLRDPARATVADFAAVRRALVQGAATDGGSDPAEALEPARQAIAGALRQWLDDELRALLREREGELRELGLDLDVALAETLTSGAHDARPASESPLR